jgi:heme a synthase
MSLNIPNQMINSFRSANKATVIAVFLLILVGGIVRSTGSGMGCPDWPLCFGNVVPPTNVNQLPEDYQEIYLQKRLDKNERFVALLRKMGFNEKAQQIADDKSILIEEEFNPLKTWIEYINRIIGVIIGFLILFTTYKSLKFWKSDKVITLVSIFNLFLVIFQAWIGSIVVSTNLLHWMITLHMALALLIVCLLIYTYYRSGRNFHFARNYSQKPNLLFLFLLIGFVLMLIQIILGTQVREQVDIVAFEFGHLMRGSWVENLGLVFLIHRSYSILILLIHILFIGLVFKYGHRQSEVYKFSFGLGLLVLIEIISGVGMAYFGIPAFLQPLHLLIGSLIIGIQFYLLMELNLENKLLLKVTTDERA